MTKLSKLYGGSLYDLAASEQLTESLLEEAETVRQLFCDNADYIRLLSETLIPKAERLALLETAFGGQIHPYLLHFLTLLCENGILQEYSGCCREFKNRYYADQGIVEGTVTSAVPLTKAQEDALTRRLEDISHKTVILTQRIDSRILGGLKVELNGQEFDGTAKGRLDGMRKTITDIIV